eukprot:126031-Hanusia_phi.AAC.3
MASTTPSSPSPAANQLHHQKRLCPTLIRHLQRVQSILPAFLCTSTSLSSASSTPSTLTVSASCELDHQVGSQPPDQICPGDLPRAPWFLGGRRGRGGGGGGWEGGRGGGGGGGMLGPQARPQRVNALLRYHQQLSSVRMKRPRLPFLPQNGALAAAVLLALLRALPHEEAVSADGLQEQGQ